jgi:hypothetical protein
MDFDKEIINQNCPHYHENSELVRLTQIYILGFLILLYDHVSVEGRRSQWRYTNILGFLILLYDDFLVFTMYNLMLCERLVFVYSFT